MSVKTLPIKKLETGSLFHFRLLVAVVFSVSTIYPELAKTVTLNITDQKVESLLKKEAECSATPISMVVIAADKRNM